MGTCFILIQTIVIFILFLQDANTVYGSSNVSTNVDMIEAETLLIKQVNRDGFGDINNQYAWSMESFKGDLYVGTLNAVPRYVGIVGTLNANMIKFLFAKPFETDGTQIYKGHINKDLESETWEWTCVIRKGNGNPYNFGVRKFKVIGDYLYGVTANHISGFEIWRTFDGISWEIVASNEFGDDTENTSARGLIAYNSYIYVGVENRKTGAKLWSRSITESGDFEINSTWNQIINDGLGHGTSTNNFFSDFVQYKGWLFIGTFNQVGMQLWRTNSIKFEKVFDFDNGKLLGDDTGVMKLYVYKDILYVGTQNFIHGASLYAISKNEHTTQFAIETVFINGNGDSRNKYVWYMTEFNNRLYVGTFSTSGAFSLFSAVDPQLQIWTNETLDGFGYGQYGVRSMTVFDGRLMIGSATGANLKACKIFECIPRVQQLTDISNGSQPINVNHDYYYPDEFNIYFNMSNHSNETGLNYDSQINNNSNYNNNIEFFSTTYGDIKKFNIYGYRYKSMATINNSYPLYIHLTGTTNNFWDNTCEQYTQYMVNSNLNFVSVSIEYAIHIYPLGCGRFIPHSFHNKASLLWDVNNPNSAIYVLCTQISFVDCNKGIVVSGFSQGAQLASQAAKFGLGEAITALYLMSGGDLVYHKQHKPFVYYPCLSFNSLNINQNKIRSIIHENDEFFGVDLEGVRREQISITNHFECDHDHDLNDNDTNAHDCIDENNGNGFYIISKYAFDASHCYMFSRQMPFCFGSNAFNTLYYNTNHKWGFKPNMNWLIDMVKNRTPQILIQFDDFHQAGQGKQYTLFQRIINTIVSHFATKRKKNKLNNHSLCSNSESTNSFTDVRVITTVLYLIIIVIILFFIIICCYINRSRQKFAFKNYDKVNTFAIEDV